MRIFIAMGFVVWFAAGCSMFAVAPQSHAPAQALPTTSEFGIMAADLVEQARFQWPPHETRLHIARSPHLDAFESVLREAGYAIAPLSSAGAVETTLELHREAGGAWQLAMMMGDTEFHRLYEVSDGTVAANSAFSVRDAEPEAGTSQWRMTLPSMTPVPAPSPLVHTEPSPPVEPEPPEPCANLMLESGSLRENLERIALECGYSLDSWPTRAGGEHVDWILGETKEYAGVELSQLLAALAERLELDIDLDEQELAINVSGFNAD